MRAGVLFFLLLGSTLLFAGKIFTFEEIHAMPQSVEKDYYIWRFLSQRTTSKQEAQQIIQEVDNPNNKKILTVYRTKTGTAPVITRQTPRHQATEEEKQRWKTNYQKLQELKKSKVNYPGWARENPQIECYLFNNCGPQFQTIPRFEHG